MNKNNYNAPQVLQSPLKAVSESLLCASAEEGLLFKTTQFTTGVTYEW